MSFVFLCQVSELHNVHIIEGFAPLTGTSHRRSHAQKCNLRVPVLFQAFRKVGCRNFVLGCELTNEAGGFWVWGRWHVRHQKCHLGLHRHVTHRGSHLERRFNGDHFPITTMRRQAFKHFSSLLFCLCNIFRIQLPEAIRMASASSHNQVRQHHGRAQGEHSQRSNGFRSRTANCLRWQTAAQFYFHEHLSCASQLSSNVVSLA